MTISRSQKNLFLSLIFLEGFFVLLIEIIGTRFLGPYFGTTIFTWSSLITVTLGSLALGYWIGAQKTPTLTNIPHTFYRSLLFASFFGSLIPFASSRLFILDSLGLKLAPLIGAIILFTPALTSLAFATTIGIAFYTKATGQDQKAPGLIFALSTVGSISGAITTGFFLVPAFPVNLTILFASLILSSLSFIGSYLHSKKFQDVIFVILITIALLFSINSNTNQNTVFEKIGFYGKVEVRQIENLGHCLLIDNIIQGCKNNLPSSSVYSTLISPLENLPLPEPRVLFLGLGAGVGPNLIKNPAAKIEAVDIDPLIVGAAQKYLALNPDIETHTEDARTFLRTTNNQYDLIVLDLFKGASLEPFTWSKEMFELTKRKLTADGILSINLPGTNFHNTPLINDITTTLLSVFPEVKELPVEGNLILFSSEKPLSENLGKTAQIKGQILTDNHNWVEKSYAETAIKIISLSRNLR